MNIGCIKKKIEIYTDGSCNNNGNRKGGWGAVLIFNGATVKLSARKAETTSNRMEMTAIIAALDKLNQSKLRVDEAMVYSDSQYAINIFNGSWRASSNVDLVEEYRRVNNALAHKGTTISFTWVKGHAGNLYNEMADQLANCNQQKEETCPTTISITPSS